jgi:hypothetical protein
MFSPASVLAQVQQGAIRQDWRVFHGKGKPVVASLLLGCFTLVFLGILCVIALEALTAFGIVTLSTSSPSTSFPLDPPVPAAPASYPLEFFWGFTGPLLLIPLVLAVLVGIIVYRRTVRQRDSVLVITPMGVVECMNYSHPTEWRYKMLDFSTLLSLDLRLHKSRETNYNATAGINTTNTRVSTWLDVSHLDGSKERWSLNHVFDRPEIIAQYIIAAHAVYTAQAS